MQAAYALFIAGYRSARPDQTTYIHPEKVHCSTPCFQKSIEYAVSSTKTKLVLGKDTLYFHNPDHPSGNQSLKHLRDRREETNWPVGSMGMIPSFHCVGKYGSPLYGCMRIKLFLFLFFFCIILSNNTSNFSFHLLFCEGVLHLLLPFCSWLYHFVFTYYLPNFKSVSSYSI